jgi:hypothetical protein
MTNKKILGAIVIIILLVQTACSGEIIVSTGKSSFIWVKESLFRIEVTIMMLFLTSAAV